MATKKEENQQSYNPFEDVPDDDQDFSALFAEQEGTKDEGEQEDKEKTKGKKPANVAELLDTLPDEQAGPLREAFKGLASQIEGLSSKGGNVTKDDIVTLVQSLQQGQNRQSSTQTSPEDVEEETSKKELMGIFKELGIDDDTKLSKVVKAIDVISEKRAKRQMDPYVRYLGERFAREEKAEINRKYPVKDGYPSLDSCSKEIAAYLQRHPNMELGEAYENINARKIFEIETQGTKKPKGGGKEETGSNKLTAEDILRKLSLTTDQPSSSTEQTVKKTGNAKTIKEAMAMAAEQLGLAK